MSSIPSYRSRVPPLAALVGSLLLLPCSGLAQDVSRAQTSLRLHASASEVKLHSRIQLQARAFVGGIDRGAASNVRYQATCGPVDQEGVLTVERAGPCTVRAFWTTPSGGQASDSTVVQVRRSVLGDLGGVGEVKGDGRKEGEVTKKKSGHHPTQPPARAAEPPPMPEVMPPPPPPPPPVASAPPPTPTPVPSSPRPAPRPPTTATRAEELPQFPWPPPRSTARAPIPRGLVTRRAAVPGEETVDTLGEVADRIEAALDRAGIERAVYAIGDSGFVYVTRTEMIERNGQPMPPPDRFPADVETASGKHGFLDALISLFRARPGFFRIIAIVVTSRPISADASGLTVAQATQLVEGGMTTLPSSLRRRTVTGLEVAALIYEYERRSQADVVHLRLAPLVSVDEHLAAAGLWSMSQLRRAP